MIKEWMRKHLYRYTFFNMLRKNIRRIKVKYFYYYTLKSDFKRKLKYDLDLNNPKTYNEKIQWLKVHYRDPIMVQCADKYGVRQIVEKKIGSDYLIDVYGVYDDVDKIDFGKLPNKFVLKPTHSSGRVIICKDKNELDISATKKKLKTWLKENYYYQNGEWVYKDIKPQIICEDLLDDNIKDYKFHFINGNLKILLIVSDRQSGSKTETYYDESLNRVNLTWGGIPAGNDQIPQNYKEMLNLSKLFAKDFPLVRVDWYEVDGKIYFGELTFFPANGLESFFPEVWDYKLGDLLDLGKCNKKYIVKGKL